MSTSSPQLFLLLLVLMSCHGGGFYWPVLNITLNFQSVACLALPQYIQTESAGFKTVAVQGPPALGLRILFFSPRRQHYVAMISDYYSYRRQEKRFLMSCVCFFPNR